MGMSSRATDMVQAHILCRHDDRATLRCRLDDEQKENQRRRDEVADLTCRLTQKEHEAFELAKYVSCLKSQLALMGPKLEKYEREAEVYSQQ